MSALATGQPTFDDLEALTLTAVDPMERRSNGRPHGARANGDAAGDLADERCERCQRHELTANDRKYKRRNCAACRQAIEREREAERDWRSAEAAPRCRCDRPAVVLDDGDRRCVRCGRAPR